MSAVRQIHWRSFSTALETVILASPLFVRLIDAAIAHIKPVDAHGFG